MNHLYAETVVKRKDTAATIGLRILMIFGSIDKLVYDITWSAIQF